MTDRATARAASERSPAVYNIAAELPFVDTLAAGLLARAGDDPAALARMLVLLPTRRACRALQEAFLRQRGGAGLLLPRLQPLGDVDEDELLLAAGDDSSIAGEALDVPPAVAPLDRLLLLARLILEDGRGAADPATAVRLARSLADLLDSAAVAEVSLDHLDTLVPDELADHWRTTLDFLAILRERWPRLLAARGEIDPMARRLRVLRALARRWREVPPANPVIAAGSTGSIPATADLLGVVARLPAGEVVLPGLDKALDDRSWDAAGSDPSHPQHALHGLLDRIGIAREVVREWVVPSRRRGAARVRLIGDALRPAATTDAWPGLAPAPDDAFDGLTRVEAASPRDEAGAIAIRLRAALETPGRRAALVTPDRGLARRVAAELRRWDVEVDDSAGTPLAATPPGAFLRLTAAAAAERLAPVALLAVLKHPLAAGGLAPGDFRARVRRLERAVLRGPRPAPGVAGLWAALLQAGPDRGAGLDSWLGGLERRVAPFAEAMAGAARPLADLLRAHVAAAEALAESDAEPGAARLWAGEAGEAAAGFVDEVLAAAEALPALAPERYPALLDALMTGRVVRPRYGRHPRLHIWGPLEARLQRADLMILGGLNDGTWPPEPAEDPWLSRPMRRQLGLPPPEYRTGLAAHDFAQACAAPEVVLTRAGKVDGAPTVASRWLLRLDALLAEDDRWRDTLDSRPLDWHRLLDEPDVPPRPVPPPMPRPPVASRPRQLSVTAVESWIRDPYAVFARRILRLRPLDPIDAEPGVLERGRMIHDALDRFLADHRERLPDDSVERLLAYGRDSFGPWLDRPAVAAFWWPRFERIAAWFVDFERSRRDAGMRVLATEVKGERRIPGPAGDFILTCVADRVDATADGALSILDYKTGVVPSMKQVDSGLSPQLPLEAAIAMAGGLEGVAARGIGELAYVRLSGGRHPGEYKRIEVRRDGAKVRPEELAVRAFEGLARRVALFDDPATPYPSRPRPQWLARAGDYDHLARVREWSAAFGREDA